MLPAAMRVNLSVRRDDFARLAEAMCGRHFSNASAAADAAVDWAERLCTDLQIPRRLGEIGVQRQHIPDLVASSRGNSMSGNPCELSDAELAQLLEQML